MAKIDWKKKIVHCLSRLLDIMDWCWVAIFRIGCTFIFVWLFYIITMSMWGTFDRNGPSEFYNQHIYELLPRVNNTNPPDTLDYEDEDWEDEDEELD
tara:strand:- start:18516 stop:18806 length:291 start_codon:yes stop_codon:yes gene_type:complete